MTVTIAIPFYNDEQYLELAIKSVLNQTYTDWKLLLVDDGSTDDSLNIAKRYEAIDSRIKVYSDGENLKLASRLNQIAQLANTKYLARMDADDIMHPERIEKQFKILEENPTIDVLGTNAYSIDKNNNIQGVRFAINASEFQLSKAKGFIHPTIMAKTQWFRENLYDEKMKRAQDAELWSRTKNESSFEVYSQPLLYYREISNGYYKKYLKNISSVFYIAYKHNSIFQWFIALRFVGKAVIYRILNLIGLEKLLTKRRNLNLNDEQKQLAVNIHNQIIK